MSGQSQVKPPVGIASLGMQGDIEMHFEDKMTSIARQIEMLERTIVEPVADVEAYIAEGRTESVKRLRRKKVAEIVTRVAELSLHVAEQIVLAEAERTRLKRARAKASITNTRERAVDIGEMYAAGQITLAEQNAGEHIKRLFDRIALYEGGGSTLGRLDQISGGGWDYDLLTAQRLDAARGWVDLQAEIAANERISVHDGERLTWAPILEAVLRDGLTFTAVEKRGTFGRRNVVRKRFRQALAAAADALGMGSMRYRSRWARDADAVPVVMSGEGE